MQKLSLQELQRPTASQFKNAPKMPVVAILDNIRSLSNVGSFFRNADAFGIKKLYLCGVTGVPPNPEIQKTAIGATQTVDYQYFDTTIAAVQQLKAQNYVILAIEQTNQSIFLNNFAFDKNQHYALIFGNEIDGVSDDVLPHCAAAIEIPQVGTKHSLNVAVSAGILFYNAMAQITNTP